MVDPGQGHRCSGAVEVTQLASGGCNFGVSVVSSIVDVLYGAAAAGSPDAGVTARALSTKSDVQSPKRTIT